MGWPSRGNRELGMNWRVVLEDGRYRLTPCADAAVRVSASQYEEGGWDAETPLGRVTKAFAERDETPDRSETPSGECDRNQAAQLLV
jgi:hypothetical protein